MINKRLINFYFSRVFLLSLFIFILLFLLNGQAGCDSHECYSDTDCTKVQTTCCSCEFGGVEECVPNLMAKAYLSKLETCPTKDDLICTMRYNCKIESCGCDKGKCIAKKKV